MHHPALLPSVLLSLLFVELTRPTRIRSADDEKASLQEAQKVLSEMSSTLKAIPGVKSVQRVVCGGCLDFKVNCVVQCR